MKILVVEDDTFTRRMLEKYLNELDFSVVSAKDGLEAWDFFCQGDIHFVVTDWMMPDMDGLELINKIRENSDNNYCYIILLTAKNDQDEIIEGISGGADDYLVKPFHKEELEVRVRAGQRVIELQEKLFKTNEQLKAELEERIMMTDVLHENEQQFRALVESIPAAVYRLRIESEWTTEFISDAIERITGYPASKFRWNPIQVYRDIIHPDDREKVNQAISQGIAPMKSFGVEYRIFDANGQIRWFYETCHAIFKEDGTPLWLDGSIYDQSDRKFAEEKLQQANRELQRLASVDGLTQIANRRNFNEYLEKEWKRMTREKGTLSLIICDIDFFKYYNDFYGHQKGDRCLKDVAQGIRSCLKRPADMVARYGGEEFAVILPNTDSGGAGFLAEQIRKEILQLKIPHDKSSVDQYVSLSLGVSTVLPDQSMSLEELIESADKALYESKNQGRNRVVIHKMKIE